MDRMDAIGLFIRVVDSGSFSAVARTLGVGQPAVSKQVAALERSLNAPLFHREHDGVRLTAAGRPHWRS